MNNDSWWKQEVIEIEAKGLAKMHGLDEQRVIRLLILKSCTNLARLLAGFSLSACQLGNNEHFF